MFSYFLNNIFMKWQIVCTISNIYNKIKSVSGKLKRKCHVKNSLKYKRSFMKNVASAHSSDIHAHARPLDIPRTSGCSTPSQSIRLVSQLMPINMRHHEAGERTWNRTGLGGDEPGPTIH